MSSPSGDERPPAAIMRGEFGLSLAEIDDDRREFIEQQLTLVSKPWGDNPAKTVRSYREERLAPSPLDPLFPLWGRDTRALAEGMQEEGVPGRPGRAGTRISVHC